MTPAARLSAAIEILDAILGGMAAERALTGWARSSRFAGSGDRAAVRDHVFDALRRRRSAAWMGGAESGRGLILGLLRQQSAEVEALFTGTGHAPAPLAPEELAPEPGAMPDALRLDMPDWLWPRLQAALGPDAETAALALRDRAPVTLRVNPGRGTREEAAQALDQDGIDALPHPVRTALRVTHGARRIRNSAAYASGLVELQDAASQEAVLRLPLRDGLEVLDFCAGGGGKALAMAALAQVQVTAHDADPARMADIAPRAARAGVTIDLAAPGAAPMADLVLVDAPCSGSGTWRRAPDAKWRLTPERLEDLLRLQDEILDTAAGRVRQGGVLAYATCSILAEENEARIAAFLSRNPGWRAALAWRRLPDDSGDGFFLSILKKD
ncbi:RsmB/NOP family class I SAM-dependent RNA methyltransferase [Pseudoroseicyclus aestuarii]|uniref:16S rRNA (Cytosine967-C5)-methyltransferase n=1 Tax=Pseudoroseicyclus aestuarii TaxID=1795041 RepID=A0A318T6Y1_9RHOB|nr:RsmB/NOP family class I SAM-dependent RNA methyltransferase [Pseudoroseicyclus aestuarii]PYE86234.1 16S rRNA (cytosine967-C5)-methyltransferase [Pseudoroseicyclus aestuarii]